MLSTGDCVGAVSTAEFEESTDLRETTSNVRINWIQLGFSSSENMLNTNTEKYYMTNASNNLRRTLCNFSGRSKDRNVAVFHSDRRAMLEIENELYGTEQSITIRNKTIDGIIT